MQGLNQWVNAYFCFSVPTTVSSPKDYKPKLLPQIYKLRANSNLMSDDTAPIQMSEFEWDAMVLRNL